MPGAAREVLPVTSVPGPGVIPKSRDRGPETPVDALGVRRDVASTTMVVDKLCRDAYR
jgi:hypothetical protein